MATTRTLATVTVSLPVAERMASYVFYRDGLGLEAVGKLAEDGVPEPLRFIVNDGLRLMLIPTGGFDWITGDHAVARPGHSECVLAVPVAEERDVDELVAAAVRAGARTVSEPAPQHWGYAGSFADPDGHIWLIRAETAGDAR
ncbi:VOC family protein [Streptomyces smyrnaeus]|uniref:VOC family protein n=1 Tax=Streptomyces TaxID=1883 RepID=UPI000C1A1D2B|nr:MULTISPECIES: VOC family protein [unclassified Streptomyces]MBQ0866512.1 VOC family protein [Streptomyces sp. RK75]MBQ1118930.1 VOC family protein [Streptomyces sp. B15]MBQ1158600.1 VOC family protein [Streptomyces sp. A73]